MKSGEALRGDLARIGSMLLDYSNPKMTAGPWAQTIEQAEFALATDGHLLFTVPRGDVPGDLPAVPEKVSKLSSKWVRAPQTNPSTISVSALQAFVGMVPPPCATCESAGQIECEDCDGSGEVDCECHCGDMHEHDCSTCKGSGGEKCSDCSGVTRARNRPAWLLGTLVDRNKVAEVLGLFDCAPDDTLSISSEDRGKMYLWRPTSAPDRMVLLASMAHVTSDVYFEKPATWASTPTAVGA